MAFPDFTKSAFWNLAIQGIQTNIPKFAMAHVRSATEEEVVVEVAVEEMEPRSEDGNGMYLPNLEAVGHMLSRASWSCQQPEGDLPVVEQSGFRFHLVQNPKKEDVLLITGVSEQLAEEKYTLRFLVHTYGHNEKIIIGQGNSLLRVLRTPTVSPVSFGELAAPSPAVSTDPAPPASTAPQPSSSSSSSASLPNLPRKSSLRSAPYTLPKRKVSFGKNSEQNVFQYMFINVTTTAPDSFKELNELMKTIGVEPRKVTYVPLPIKALHKFAMYFQVYDTDAEKVEALIEERNWADTFNPATMATTRNGNMAKAMSMQDIMEAMILSTMVATSTGEDPSGISLRSSLQELIGNKKHLKAAMNRKGVVEHVAERLSNKGTAVLLNLLKQHT
ncbi:unnamed protein product [Caenorhabditis brenneri]